MFEKVCKYCNCPLSYYKNKESTYGCRINIVNEYGTYVGRHKFEYKILLLFKSLCSSENY